MKKTVIIGGVAGGASCAARLRRLQEDVEIIILERGKYISYANCGLPYHVGDVIKSRESLLVSTPEMMRQRFNIDVRVENEAVKIDRDKKTVTVKDHSRGTSYEESYDDLVISTGSAPVRPDMPGMASDLIKNLWTIPDTDKIRSLALESGAKSAAVVGGGFIGLEVVENLREAGIDVTLVQGSDHVMPPIDKEMAMMLHEHMTVKGVKIFFNDRTEAFEELENGGRKSIKMKLKSGKELTVDFVVLSIGVTPNSRIAKGAGLLLNDRGMIVVDDCMRTEDPHVYAVGDVIEVEDFTFKSRAQYQLAGPANKQGRIAANNIVGDKDTYKGTQATSIAKVFDLTVGMTGHSEERLTQRGLKNGVDYEAVYVTQNQHAGYYPGAMAMVIKMIFAKRNGKILGAQIIGPDGVDKRIDTISVAARLGATAQELADLEMAYAPPYSSAKDPVNMTGFTARNVSEGLIRFSRFDEPDDCDDIQLVDVREEAETMAVEIPGAKNIPLGQLRARMNELDRDKPVITLCSVGVRSYNAARILQQHGFKDVKVYPAGTRFYQATHPENDPSDETPSEDTPPEGNKAERNFSANDKAENIKTINLDCNGMQCPGPIMKVYETIRKMNEGDIMQVLASDPGFVKDIGSWCRRTGNTLISTGKEKHGYVACLKKGGAGKSLATSGAAAENASCENRSKDRKTIIVFSGDMDKVMASFIIANGAAAMGRPVTMFFTFWGLSVLRKAGKQTVKKPFMEAMFGKMLPRGAGRLKISKMNMGGMGTSMMKKIMKDKNVDSLEDLIRKAMKAGVKIVACTMSMDVMGIREKELIDGVELGGVGYYLGDAEDSNVNLFI